MAAQPEAFPDIPPPAIEFPMDQRGAMQSGLLPVFGPRGPETLARRNGVVGCNRYSPVAYYESEAA
jgi:hypothetical protein